MGPHATLLKLFQRRDAVEKELRQLDAAIASIGRLYSKEQGYIFPLTTSKLRNLVQRQQEKK